MLTPDPFKIPPQEPVYQYQFAPVPKDPPFLITEVADPIHIIAGFIDNESGATELVFNDTVVLLHPVVLQEPCALT